MYIVHCRMIFYLTISTEYDRDVCAPSINMYSTSHGVLSLGTGTYAFRLAKVASHGASRIQTWRPNWRLIGLAASTSVMHRLWSVWSRSEHKFSFSLQHLLMHFLLAKQVKKRTHIIIQLTIVINHDWIRRDCSMGSLLEALSVFIWRAINLFPISKTHLKRVILNSEYRMRDALAFNSSWRNG